MGTTASTMCVYAQGTAQGVYDHLKDYPDRRQVPPEVTHILDALAESQLLGAAAATLVDAPNIFAAADLSADVREAFLEDIRHAADAVAMAVHSFAKLRSDLAERWGPQGQTLAAGVARALGHEAVKRLQVALLDQLAVEAGMGLALGEGCEVEEAGRAAAAGRGG